MVMIIPRNVKTGPLSRCVSNGAEWDDGYPVYQVYADELERLCTYLDQEGKLERFRPRLRARNRERDSALNEIRVAFYFHSQDFPVVEWEPPGQGGKTGEFQIASLPQGDKVFIEIKGPTWESELSQSERLAGRTHQPKYLNAEGRWFDNSEHIRFAIDKAYKKFSPIQANLLVIADDLSVSLRHGTSIFVEQALYDTRRNGYFTRDAYRNLGGVGVFWTDVESDAVAYQLQVFVNNNALAATKLQQEFVERFAGQVPAVELGGSRGLQ
jgi:hypothetical protein